MVAGDNDHFRRQLVVLEVVRAGQAVAGPVAAHIDHLVSGPRLTFLPLCLIRLARPQLSSSGNFYNTGEDWRTGQSSYFIFYISPQQVSPCWVKLEMTHRNNGRLALTN